MHGKVYSCIDGIHGDSEKDNRFLASYWFTGINEHNPLSVKQRSMVYQLNSRFSSNFLD